MRLHRTVPLSLCFVLATGTLGACVAQQTAPEQVKAGMYPNYRVMFQGEMYRISRDKDFADCSGAWMVDNVSPSDLAMLDRYARGEITFSAIDPSIDEGLRARIKGKTNTEFLRPYCPDKVDGFKLPAN
jgi:hypothetical protein